MKFDCTRVEHFFALPFENEKLSWFFENCYEMIHQLVLLDTLSTPRETASSSKVVGQYGMGWDEMILHHQPSPLRSRLRHTLTHHITMSDQFFLFLFYRFFTIRRHQRALNDSSDSIANLAQPLHACCDAWDAEYKLILTSSGGGSDGWRTWNTAIESVYVS